MAKKKDDIDRKVLKYMSSGQMPKKEDHPDKAYDPNKLLRQQLDEGNDKNGPKTAQTEDKVVAQEHNYPGDKKDKYAELKKYLRTMNSKK